MQSMEIEDHNQNWDKDNAIELDIDSTHELSWNIGDFHNQNTQWFHFELLQVDDATPQGIHDGQKFSVMNFIVNFCRNPSLGLPNLQKEIVGVKIHSIKMFLI